MTFLATYWWAFLVGTGVFAGLGAFLQLRNMKSIVTEAKSMFTDPDNAGDAGDAVVKIGLGVFARFKGVAVCGFLMTGCGIVTAVGVIAALIEHFKATP